jgi:stage III sporulation protein AB
MLENIEILLSYKRLSVNEIFYELANNDTFDLLDFIKKINHNMIKTNNNYILSCENKQFIISNNHITKNDKENLINFFSTLGKSDLNGQLLNCKTYKDMFKKNLEKLKKMEQNECKSTGTLIIGVGFLLVILIY